MKQGLITDDDPRQMLRDGAGRKAMKELNISSGQAETRPVKLDGRPVEALCQQLPEQQGVTFILPKHTLAVIPAQTERAARPLMA